MGEHDSEDEPARVHGEPARERGVAARERDSGLEQVKCGREGEPVTYWEGEPGVGSCGGGGGGGPCGGEGRGQGPEGGRWWRGWSS